MKKLSAALFVMIIILSSQMVSSQVKDTVKKHGCWHEAYGWTNIKPTIQFFYGMNTHWLSKETHRDYQMPFPYDFTKEASLEARLGTTSERLIYKKEGISETEFSGPFFKYQGKSSFLKNETNKGEFLLKQIQFGIFTSKGYGYTFGDDAFGVYLYTGGSINWSDIKYTYYQKLPIEVISSEALQTYDGVLRFGQSFESGLKIKFPGPVNIIAAYDKSIVYPRHLFWKWTISELIEGIATGAADGFSKAIMNHAPYAGPVANFVLKTAILYGMYELRKHNMNWPFTTSPPLVTDTWKIGLSFEF